MRRLIFMFIVISVIAGCKPEDGNKINVTKRIEKLESDEAKVEVIKHETETKAEVQKVITEIKIRTERIYKNLAASQTFFLFGLFGGIVVAALRLPKMFTNLGAAVVLASGVGLGLTTAMVHIPKPVAYAGLAVAYTAAGFGVILCIFAIIIKCRSFSQAIEGGEDFKKVASAEAIELFRESQKNIQKSKTGKKSMTEKLVEAEQEKIKKAEVKNET